MKGIGTIVNVLAIIMAGSLGVMIRGKWSVRFQRLILQYIGAVVLFLGGRSLLSGWFVKGTPGVEVTGTILVLFALPVGMVFGEALQLHRLLDKLGLALSHTFSREDAAAKENTRASSGRKGANRRAAEPAVEEFDEEEDAALGEDIPWWQISKRPVHDLPATDLRSGSRFADGFVLSTLICAFSAMSFTGAITEGMTGDTKELFIKAAIDAVIIFFLSTIYGAGAAFGAVSVSVVQGLMTFISDHRIKQMTPTLIAHLTIISAVITIAVGAALCFGKKWKVANLIPALLISPLYGIIMQYADKMSGK